MPVTTNKAEHVRGIKERLWYVWPGAVVIVVVIGYLLVIAGLIVLDRASS